MCVLEMKIKSVDFLLLLLSIERIFGCHSPTPTRNTPDAGSNDYDDGVARLRRRRQALSTSLSTEEFFVRCMYRYPRYSNIDIKTVVGFTIKETSWFQKADSIFCKRQDTVTCWRRILFRYLKANSQLRYSALSCIYKFGGFPPYGQYAVHNPMVTLPRYSGRRRRQAIRHLALNEAVIEYQLRQALPYYIGDIRTIIALVKDETICGPGICNCNGILVPREERCGETWYTRIGSIIRLDSNARTAVLGVMNSAILSAQRQLQNNLARRRRINLMLQYFLMTTILDRFSSRTSENLDVATSYGHNQQTASTAEYQGVTAAATSTIQTIIITTVRITTSDPRQDETHKSPTTKV